MMETTLYSGKWAVPTRAVETPPTALRGRSICNIELVDLDPDVSLPCFGVRFPDR